MQTPKIVTMKYTNPVWAQYNEDLLQITDESRRRGVIIADSSGHFIQKDNPQFVADEMSLMLSKIL